MFWSLPNCLMRDKLYPYSFNCSSVNKKINETIKNASLGIKYYLLNRLGKATFHSIPNQSISVLLSLIYLHLIIFLLMFRSRVHFAKCLSFEQYKVNINNDGQRLDSNPCSLVSESTLSPNCTTSNAQQPMPFYTTWNAEKPQPLFIWILPLFVYWHVVEQ